MTNLTNGNQFKEAWDVIQDGFFPMVDKKSSEKIKGEKGYEWDAICVVPEFGARLKQEVIMIDIDDLKTSELVLNIINTYGIKTIVVESANRGMHFYFRNNGVISSKTKANLAIGIKADIKVGLGTVVAPVKSAGEFRRLLTDSTTLAILPEFLKPISAKQTDVIIDDQARNSSIYSHIYRLRNQGFAAETIKEICTIINSFIFDKPLDTKEIETLLSSDALKETQKAKVVEEIESEFEKEVSVHPNSSNWFSKDKDKRFLHEVLAKYMIRFHNICKIDGIIYGYFNNKYEPTEENFGTLIRLIYPQILESKAQEVFTYIKYMAPVAKPDEGRYINFTNGLLDTTTWELVPHDSKIITINQFQTEYDETAEDPTDIWKSFMTSICQGDTEKIDLIQEYMGYCLIKTTKFQKFMLFTGPGGNGKSTLTNAFKKALGADAVASMDIKDLNDKFRTYMIYNKSVAICDDIAKTYLKDTSNLKKVVSGDEIVMEKKFENSVNFTPYAKIFASANELPTFADKGDSIYRRLILVNLNNKYKDKPDTQLPVKLGQYECSKYIIKWAVDGLKRLLTNGKFSSCKDSDVAIAEFKIENDPLKSWIEETGISTIEGFKTKEAYLDYRIFCSENGYLPVANSTFGRQMAANDFESRKKRVDGVQSRYYIYQK